MFAHIRLMGLAATLAAMPPLALAGKAAAATPCGDHGTITAALKSKYKEERRIMGVINSRTVMEIFTSEKGSWTVVLTEANGRSCITAAGEDWQEVPV
jgi:hypothetical protein